MPLEKMLLLSSCEAFSLQFEFITYDFLPHNGPFLVVLSDMTSLFCTLEAEEYCVFPLVHFPSRNALSDMLMMAPSLFHL